MNVHFPTDNPTDDASGEVPLTGTHGDLYLVSIVADPHDLEDLLDRLGQSRFPIDPQIYHDAQVDGRSATLVEFPAYSGWLDDIRTLLDARQAVTIRKCLTHRAPN
jgi:hypothetical protein